MSSLQIPESIRGLFDSCRDDFDLAQPEMLPLRAWLDESGRHREALAAMRRKDMQIKVALHNVAIPSGLSEKIIRLVDGVDSSHPAALLVGNIDLSRVDFGLPAERNIAPRMVPHFATNRSNWLAVGAAVATISAVVIFIVSWGQFQPAPPLNPSARELCLASLAWIQQADNSPWLTDGGPSAEDRPFVPKYICRKQIQTDFGPTACYLTSLNNGTRVFLFVFHADGSMGLPSLVPSRPDLPSQGFMCSAYQQGDQVFVVAVEGDTNNYRQALQHGLPVSRSIQGTPRGCSLAGSGRFTWPRTTQRTLTWLIRLQTSIGSV